MATINVYSPFYPEHLEQNAKIRITYFREHQTGSVAVSVQHADPDELTDGHPTYGSGVEVVTNLDRDGINDLIRALRIARDKAYGRDE